MKKYGDAFLVIIGLLIIVGTVICYLFYYLNPTTMYAEYNGWASPSNTVK